MLLPHIPDLEILDHGASHPSPGRRLADGEFGGARSPAGANLQRPARIPVSGSAVGGKAYCLLDGSIVWSLPDFPTTTA